MNRENDLLQENQALRDRLSRLSEASAHINQSLDFNVVLQEVIDNARYLTNARYGVIASTNEVGGLDSVLTSGTTEDEHHQLVELPGGTRIFNHFSKIPGPLRVDNYPEFAESVGLDGWLPMTVITGLAAPIRHNGELVGIIWLGRSEEENEFSEEDEETLVMFASQAAMVLSISSRYRDEQRSRIDLETLIGTTPVGVGVFDARTGAVVSTNREWMRIIDTLLAPEESPGTLAETLTIRRADGRELSLADMPIEELLRAGEKVRAEEMVFSVPSGRNITVLLNGNPILSENGEVESLIVTMQDMTPLKEVERLRAEFLAMVSHELRTPLATVRGSVSTLLDESSDMHPAEMRQFHNIILEQTDRMRALIADLLDVARIETGILPVSPQPTDLAVLISEAGNAFRIGGHRHNLSINVPLNLPWVMGDKSRIMQVLGNLLGNAARHSPESSAITVSAAPGDLQVSVSVSDEGMGIPAESLPHLFRKFSRIENEDQSGDTGLGLSVCKGIVEAHGGRIWAESDGPGLGARFTFTLPTVEEAGFVSPEPSRQLSTPSARRSGREQLRILAVDDDDQALRYIRDALAKSDYAVIATVDPEDVLRLVEEEKPHLVLLDLMLPGVDGIDLMKEIVSARDVPVIFVSAYGQDQLVARAFEMGADDYVVKPFSPTELVARIRAALRRRTTSEPSVPYAVGDLTIDYVQRLVTLEGNPIDLTAIQYRLLVELSANAGRVLTYEHLLRRVWGTSGDADVRPMRTAISAIRSKLGDDADNPTYILTKLRVGYSMPKADMP
ncbi:MAG: response regulator [Dehalococcoidia bacterium]|nr:response regulator [Dehalococcoidia bacterium]